MLAHGVVCQVCGLHAAVRECCQWFALCIVCRLSGEELYLIRVPVAWHSWCCACLYGLVQDGCQAGNITIRASRYSVPYMCGSNARRGRKFIEWLLWQEQDATWLGSCF